MQGRHRHSINVPIHFSQREPAEAAPDLGPRCAQRRSGCSPHIGGQLVHSQKLDLDASKAANWRCVSLNADQLCIPPRRALPSLTVSHRALTAPVAVALTEVCIAGCHSLAAAARHPPRRPRPRPRSALDEVATAAGASSHQPGPAPTKHPRLRICKFLKRRRQRVH
jgi:hypothetical protein